MKSAGQKYIGIVDHVKCRQMVEVVDDMWYFLDVATATQFIVCKTTFLSGSAKWFCHYYNRYNYYKLWCVAINFGVLLPNLV